MRALAAFAVFASLAFADEVKKEIYADFNYGQTAQGNEMWVQSIKVLSPEYRSDVKGEVAVEFSAPGMKYAVAKCRRQPAPAGAKKQRQMGKRPGIGRRRNNFGFRRAGLFQIRRRQVSGGPHECAHIRLQRRRAEGRVRAPALQQRRRQMEAWNPQKNSRTGCCCRYTWRCGLGVRCLAQKKIISAYKVKEAPQKRSLFFCLRGVYNVAFTGKKRGDIISAM